MLKKISKLPFEGTAEQEKMLKEIIKENCHDKSLLMTVMQKAQDIYGYLPMEVQNMIAEGMDVPLEKVYGVATFYAQFSLAPKGEYNISVCLGTACYVKGAQSILDSISEKLGIGVDECTADRKFSLTACRCIGACGLGPVLTVNDEVYGKLKKEGINARKYFYPLTNSFECYKSFPNANVADTPVAQQIALRVLTLPLYADLAISDIDKICDIILN